MAINYGFHATSLDLIPKKLFLELGNMMNKQKSFTVTASLLENASIGDVNQHFDCVSVPNMGGYNFPPSSVLSSKNLFIGLVGIDEVVLGKKVFRTESMWKRYQPIIKKELEKWEKYVDQITHVHVSTISDKQQMVDYLKIPEEKIDVIPLGVDHDLFKPSLNKEKTRKNVCSKFFLKEQHYFVHVSEVNWARKNILRLFEAFKKAKLYGIPHYLIVVGKNESIVYEKAKEIPGVIMLGFVEQKDLIEIIQGSEALINPSLHEGFGFPLVESMACGIPVVTSNVFSPPEIVENGGLFVDPYSTSDIFDKILEMVNNEKLKENLSQEALKRSKYFSWTVTAKKLLELFEKHTMKKIDNNFDECYDLAAFRTLTTICQIHPKLMTMARHDLLEGDYSRLINWSLVEGLNDPQVKDYLTPFTKWLEEHS
jgi:glycosyltransferase involved in cell wall biosynthesis